MSLIFMATRFSCNCMQLISQIYAVISQNYLTYSSYFCRCIWSKLCWPGTEVWCTWIFPPPLIISAKEVMCGKVGWYGYPSSWTLSFPHEFRNISLKRGQAVREIRAWAPSCWKQYSMEMLCMWPDTNVQRLMRIFSTDWFNIKVIWNYHTIFLHSTSDYYSFVVSFMFLNLYCVFCAPNSYVLKVCESWVMKTSSPETSIRCEKQGIRWHAVVTQVRKGSSLAVILFSHFMWTCYFVPKHANQLFQNVLYGWWGNPNICSCSPRQAACVLREAGNDCWQRLLQHWGLPQVGLF